MSTWTTKDGINIPIKDLDDDHLINIIKLLYSQVPQMKRKLKEITTLGYTQEDEIIEHFVPKFPVLLDEMAKRGLATRVYNL